MDTVIRVDGMSCQHCVRAVENSLLALAGVQAVVVDLDAKTVSVTHGSESSIEQMQAAIEDEGYTVLR